MILLLSKLMTLVLTEITTHYRMSALLLPSGGDYSEVLAKNSSSFAAAISDVRGVFHPHKGGKMQSILIRSVRQ